MDRPRHVLVTQKPISARGWHYDFLINLGVLLGRVLLFWRTFGAENIPRDGPLLVIANHPTYVDPPTLVITVVYYARRDLSIMAWDALFRIPLVRFFARNFKAYPVNRENPGRAPYATLLQLLRAGGAAGMFPEGGRSEQRLMGAWKPGALRAALVTKATILPVTFVTAGEFWPMDRWRPRLFRGHHVVIHKPLTYDEYMADRPEGMRDKEFQPTVEKRITAIIDAPLLERDRKLQEHQRKQRRSYDPFGQAESGPAARRQERYGAARARLRSRS